MNNQAVPVFILREARVEYARSSKKFTYPDIKIKGGECVCISGPTGCGKTTLLNALFQPSFPGKVTYKEASVSGQDLKSFSKGIFGTTSYMPQYAQDGLNPAMTVVKQIEAVMTGNNLKLSQDEINTKLAALNLEPSVLKLYPHQMSGGMKQRLALMLAHLKKPVLMVLDEPSSAIDALTLRCMLDYLIAAKLGGAGLLIVSHDLGFTRHIADVSVSLEAT